ncbi:MAG: hypothetical protein JXA39_06465 [Bacteroidales bacterium]|nr:hypothetical protein [Bacteroidales bacterium]
MKATTTISIILITVFTAWTTIHAQSVHSRNANNKNRTSHTGIEKENKQIASTLPESRSKSSAVRIESRNDGRGSDRQQYQSGNSVQTNRNQQSTAGRSVENRTYKDPKHMSIVNTRDQRGIYLKPGNTVTSEKDRDKSYAKDNRSDKHYDGTRHYHHAYPKERVTIHYHRDAYGNNYKILYHPAHKNIHWTRAMYRDYVHLYPSYTYWHYEFGHSIKTIPTFKARYNLGEVARIYGRVYATWYNKQTDDYLLFFGGDYPFQDFTVIIPGVVARMFSRRPHYYFSGKHITATGLITSYAGKPEMVIKRTNQISTY